MSRIFHVAALVVLALWVPATVHCDLESVLGLVESACCGDHGEAQPSPAAPEHCAVENGDYFANHANVIVAAPDLLTWWCGDALRLDPPAGIAGNAPERVESPPELAHTWQFTARTALPARAPSLVS